MQLRNKKVLQGNSATPAVSGESSTAPPTSSAVVVAAAPAAVVDSHRPVSPVPVPSAAVESRVEPQPADPAEEETKAPQATTRSSSHSESRGAPPVAAVLGTEKSTARSQSVTNRARSELRRGPGVTVTHRPITRKRAREEQADDASQQKKPLESLSEPPPTPALLTGRRAPQRSDPVPKGETSPKVGVGTVQPTATGPKQHASPPSTPSRKQPPAALSSPSSKVKQVRALPKEKPVEAVVTKQQPSQAVLLPPPPTQVQAGSAAAAGEKKRTTKVAAPMDSAVQAFRRRSLPAEKALAQFVPTDWGNGLATIAKNNSQGASSRAGAAPLAPQRNDVPLEVRQVSAMLPPKSRGWRELGHARRAAEVSEAPTSGVPATKLSMNHSPAANVDLLSVPTVVATTTGQLDDRSPAECWIRHVQQEVIDNLSHHGSLFDEVEFLSEEALRCFLRCSAAEADEDLATLLPLSTIAPATRR